jgi:hypothetical protein
MLNRVLKVRKTKYALKRKKKKEVHPHTHDILTSYQPCFRFRAFLGLRAFRTWDASIRAMRHAARLTALASRVEVFVGESGWRAMSRSRSRISSLSSTFSGFAHGGGVFFGFGVLGPLEDIKRSRGGKEGR